MTDDMWATFMLDQNVELALRRETTDNPIYTGEIDRVAGLVIIHSPCACAGYTVARVSALTVLPVAGTRRASVECRRQPANWAGRLPLLLGNIGRGRW